MSSYLIIDAVCLYLYNMQFLCVHLSSVCSFHCYITCMNDGNVACYYKLKLNFWNKKSFKNQLTHISPVVCVCVCLTNTQENTLVTYFYILSWLCLEYSRMNRCIVFCAYALEREGGNSGVCSIENKNYSFNLSAHFKEETSDNRAYLHILLYTLLPSVV